MKLGFCGLGLMGAAAAFAGQNLGAGRPERSVRGVDSGREIPALSGAWLTGLDAAG